MADDEGEAPQPQRRRPPRRTSTTDLATLFGLSRDAVERLLARPPHETQILRTIAALLETQPDGWGELIDLYSRMTPAQRETLLVVARAALGSPGPTV